MTNHIQDDVARAAQQAQALIKQALEKLPKATEYDYGGHQLAVSQYKVCQRCTAAIAEAQQAYYAIRTLTNEAADGLIKEHLDIAADVMQAEAEIAKKRAMLHGGQSSEGILNVLLEFIHQRNIHDAYDHSHEANS